jgi:hypothetical protein
MSLSIGCRRQNRQLCRDTRHVGDMSATSSAKLLMRQFLVKPPPQIQPTMTSMGQMIPKQPLIIIIWIYQEMMVWMSRKSICILYSLMEDFWLRSWAAY